MLDRKFTQIRMSQLIVIRDRGGLKTLFLFWWRCYFLFDGVRISQLCPFWSLFGQLDRLNLGPLIWRIRLIATLILMDK